MCSKASSQIAVTPFTCRCFVLEIEAIFRNSGKDIFITFLCKIYRLVRIPDKKIQITMQKLLSVSKHGLKKRLHKLLLLHLFDEISYLKLEEFSEILENIYHKFSS